MPEGLPSHEHDEEELDDLDRDKLDQDEEETEDPLAGDVDRFVHPDETRTEEQEEFDRKYAVGSYDDEDDDEEE